MTHNQLDKALYQAMKVAAKQRKIKLSAERNIYKKVDPYFFGSHYHLHSVMEEMVYIELRMSVKYHRFDELQYGIISPNGQLRFTDKIRANSGAMCNASHPRMVQPFVCDGTLEALPKLCEDILDFLEKYYTDFLTMANREYGDLNGYFIAHMDEQPRLAGLAYLDKGDYQGAITCFMHPNMDGANSIWAVDIHTDEQRRRAKASGVKILSSTYGEGIHRSRRDQFVDYAIALQNGLDWNAERAFYGLLPEERKGVCNG